MNGTNRGGRRLGSGKGQGQGSGLGRKGGPLVGGAVGTCVCPQCGHHEPHERGVPCTQVQCPKCKTKMVRG